MTEIERFQHREGDTIIESSPDGRNFRTASGGLYRYTDGQKVNDFGASVSFAQGNRYGI